jgi:hypothetical protein
VARVLDTTPAFEEFARRAFLESPVVRERLWLDRYEAAHPEVFEAFHAIQPNQEGRNALVRELSLVRQKAREAAPVMNELIEEVEPAVQEVLGLPPALAPRHVLLVGTYATNAIVAPLEGEVTLFHCLEWFQSREGARVLVAHEDTHACHQLQLGEAPREDDAAWMAFYEGVAIQASRAVVPDAPEDDYFWYGHVGFEDWLPWCQEHRDDLMERFRSSLDDPAAVDSFFGGGLVEERWRVGFFLADELVAGLGRPLPELVTLSVAEGSRAIRAALGA